RQMVYDGLDRLTGAIAPLMFGSAGASYSYDVLDNLTHVLTPDPDEPTGVRDHYYCYDEAWRLTNVMTGSCTGTGTVVGLGYDAQGNLLNKNGQLFDFDYGNR